MVRSRTDTSARDIFFIVLTSSLGYFVDAYDLIITSLGRVESINDLRLATQTVSVKEIGVQIESGLAYGLILGALFFGVFADRVGRIRALYGSIALYSIATLLNGLLDPSFGLLETVDSNNTYLLFNHYSLSRLQVLNIYAWLRTIAGFGLAAELGIAVVLVSEFLGSRRGIGTMIIAAVGLCGAVFAAAIDNYTPVSWGTLYVVGGIMGLLLLVFRIFTKESEIFKSQRKSPNTVVQGNLLAVFSNKKRLILYIKCIAIGLPTYVVISLPIKFASVFGKAFDYEINFPVVIMVFYFSMVVGDIFCNYMSQRIKKTKPLLVAYNLAALLAISFLVLWPPHTSWAYHFIYTPLLGLSVGYWALIATVAAGSFGTNLRATVTTTVLNLLRATLIPITLAWLWLESVLKKSNLIDGNLATLYAVGIIGFLCCGIALWASFTIEESFTKNLNTEER